MVRMRRSRSEPRLHPHGRSALGWAGLDRGIPSPGPNIDCIARSRSSKQIGGDFPLDI